MQPVYSSSAFVLPCAASQPTGKARVVEPLWAMTFWKYWFASFMTGRMETEPPPALCPKMVTLPGSPPKAAMFSCTHLSAIAWSSRPLQGAVLKFSPPGTDEKSMKPYMFRR